MTNAAEVYLWSTRVGIIRLDDTDGYVTYEYDRNFLDSGIELAPAYDLTYSYKAGNRWLAAHQMTVNGKNQHISLSDLLKAGQSMELSSSKCQKIINEVTESIQHWSEYAELARLDEDKAAAISQSMLKNGIAVTSQWVM